MMPIFAQKGNRYSIKPGYSQKWQYRAIRKESRRQIIFSPRAGKRYRATAIQCGWRRAKAAALP